MAVAPEGTLAYWAEADAPRRWTVESVLATPLPPLGAFVLNIHPT